MEADEESDNPDENDDDDDDDSDIPGIEKEKPGEGLKRKQKLQNNDESAPKKQKLAEQPAEGEAPASKRQKAREEKRLAKKQRKEEAKRRKREAKLEKERNAEAGEKKAKADEAENKTTAARDDSASESETEEPATEDAPVQPSNEADKPSSEADKLSNDADSHQGGEELAPIDVSGLDGKENEASSADSTEESGPHSPVFDAHPGAKNASAEPASTTTSISSAVPPSEKPKYLKIPADTTALRARLESKLAALRAARKADDPDGKPIRTRQELIEARREKQAQRKAHKKEMRRRAKEEEERKREEALASARNSPGLSPLFEQDDDRNANHYAYGRLTFSDGTQLSHDLSYEKTPNAKKKGPSDPKTALLKLEAQKKRIANMDEDKRKEVLEKETWLAARRRAEGEKVHDNESLLKKALKRKEKAKKKSEREWKERIKGVEKAMQERQRKREENIRKRREEKLAARAGKKKNKGVATRKKNRPGFEGGFGSGKK